MIMSFNEIIAEIKLFHSIPCLVHTFVVVAVSGVVRVDVMTNLAFISRDVEGN